MKHKFSFVGETIAFSICNKPFKPLGFPSGRVKSREGLSEMKPTKIEVSNYQLCKNHHSNTWFTHHEYI
jgi:hypothetical protein